MKINDFLALVNQEKQDKVKPLLDYLDKYYCYDENMSDKSKMPCFTFNHSFIKIGCRKNYLSIYFSNNNAFSFIKENYPYCKINEKCINFSYKRSLPYVLLYVVFDRSLDALNIDDKDINYSKVYDLIYNDLHGEEDVNYVKNIHKYKVLELVAYKDNQEVGYIMFSKINKFILVCPLVVKKEYQKRGIGTKLMNIGLEQFKEEDIYLVGDINYYQRFGFKQVENSLNKSNYLSEHVLHLGIGKEVFSLEGVE